MSRCSRAGIIYRALDRAALRSSTACTVRSSAGFTLLEVMLALAILALGLTITSEAQQIASRQVLRAKMLTTATLLARDKMVDVEDELFKEGFSDFDEEQTGEFGDPFKSFRYRLAVEKVELPATVDAEALGQAVSEGSGATDQGAAGGMAAMAGQMVGQFLGLIRGTIEQSIRRVTLDVMWKEGRRERSIRVSSYFTDPRQVDAAMGGLGALEGLLPAGGGAGGQPAGGGAGGQPAATEPAGRGP